MYCGDRTERMWEGSVDSVGTEENSGNWAIGKTRKRRVDVAVVEQGLCETSVKMCKV